MGCLGCKNFYKRHGYAQCRQEPHNYQNPLQKSMVQWLLESTDHLRDGGCPGFERIPHEDKVPALRDDEVPQRL